jgi:hypothetical protein
MTRARINIFISILFFFCALNLQAQERKEPVRILFVGNSFTYFYNLSQVVASMAESQGVELFTRQSTVGGSSLEQHWKEENGTETRKLLDSLKWDYVVLNNHSLATIDDPEGFLKYSNKFVDLVRSKGAQPVFMQTWGYKNNPLMITTITQGYDELVTSAKCDMVPCGELFAEVRKWRPDLEMFQDYKHPSYNGTYLLGLAFFKYFTGLSTEDIPKRLWTKDINGEKLGLMFMSQEDADFLQLLVDEFEFEHKAGE